MADQLLTTVRTRQVEFCYHVCSWAVAIGADHERPTTYPTHRETTRNRHSVHGRDAVSVFDTSGEQIPRTN